jgi:predicted nucleotidyltransferase
MQLPSEYRNEIVNYIHQGLTVPVSIYLHGSRAKNSAHQGSDIDIVVKPQGNQPIPKFELMQVRARLSEGNIPYFVDIQDWDALPDWLKREIQQTGIIL